MTGKKIKNRVFICLICIIITLLCTQLLVMADEPEFILSIDSLSLEMGVSTNLVLSLVNAQDAKVLKIEGLENFDVLSSSQSTYTSIINNKATYKKDHNYIIMPKKTGEFTVQASVEYKGVTYRTNELKITVKETTKDTTGDLKDIFIKTNISANEIYFGQKAVLTYELYSRYNIEDFGFLDSINIDGFMLNDVKQEDLKASYVYLQDKKYIKCEARQIILSPLKTGTFTIPAYNFQVNVSTGDFFRSSKPFYLQTESREITVKSLPLGNQPSDFSGIIGNLNIESNYSKNELNIGDSLTLNVAVSGSCNLEVLDKIIPGGIPGFSVYESEKDIEENIENNQYMAKKEFEIILVPETNGEIKIEPFYISYFNPETGNYEQAEIPGTTITVHDEAPAAQNRVIKETGPASAVKIDQVNYRPNIEGYITINLEKEKLLIAVYVLTALLAAGIAGYIFYSYRRKNNKELNELYKKIKRSSDENEIFNLLNALIKKCFGVSIKASTRNEINEKLAGYGLAVPVLEVVEYLESKKALPDRNPSILKKKIKDIYNRARRCQPSI
ncbi:MAG TPA: BatD family protein [Clostridia bacterium]